MSPQRIGMRSACTSLFFSGSSSFIRAFSDPEAVVGGDVVSGVRLRDRKSGEMRVHPVKGVFVHVGLEPNTTFLQGLVALDGAGHIETDAMMRTSRPGLFAAGDIRKGSVALIAAVAGDGATAAVAAVRYLQMGT